MTTNVDHKMVCTRAQTTHEEGALCTSKEKRVSVMYNTLHLLFDAIKIPHIKFNICAGAQYQKNQIS